MKALRQVGTLAFVLGLFTTVFAGLPWAVVTADDPVVPGWLRVAVFSLLGGILVVLLTVVPEQRKHGISRGELPLTEPASRVLLMNSGEIPGREITEILGLGSGPYGIRYLAWPRSLRHPQISPWGRADRIHGDDGKGSGDRHEEDDGSGHRDGRGRHNQCSLHDDECCCDRG